MKRVLIANRGEVAVRVARAAAELGLQTVAVYAGDDDRSLHVKRADHAAPLHARGASAYLDIDAMLEVATREGCDAVHPGYGFLSESAEFARGCERAGITFVGPNPGALATLGDKSAARALAAGSDVPLLAGTTGPTSLAEARAFMEGLGPGEAAILKAVMGGGGRGIRPVLDARELDEAYARCRSEAESAFGDGALYIERYLPRARHIEVQIVGDRHGHRCHLWERECSLQRRRQKLVEVAPSPTLAPVLRNRLLSCALHIAQAVEYDNIGTIEFLVDDRVVADDPRAFAFMEANPRLQVEHTVTEEVTGVDLVQAQLRIAMGQRLADLDIDPQNPPPPRGYALQARVNMERMLPGGDAQPTGGTVTTFDLASGPGLRSETAGYAGYATPGTFDSLLLKLIAYTPSSRYRDVVVRAQRGLRELRIEGIETNRTFLLRLLEHPAVQDHAVHTAFVQEHLTELLQPGGSSKAPLHFPASAALPPEEASRAEPAMATAHLPEGTFAISSPMQGTIVSIDVSVGDALPSGGPVAVMDAMKMEHLIRSEASGYVASITVRPGQAVMQGQIMMLVTGADVEAEAQAATEQEDPDHIRADLAELRQRLAYGMDAQRPGAVEKRRKTGHRTARENVADLCDPDSFVEYGGLVIAAQRRRRELQDLIERTPADGLVSGIGRVNGELFPDDRAQCAVLSYDYTVLAGTQGAQNHRKKDRMFEVIERLRVPVVFFAEGGGGRPGDSDASGVAGLDYMAFQRFGKLSGLVPLVGIATGRCFAGNAALLGSCDVVIATEGTNIGMGGPAMIEGGGLGVFAPEDIGPLEVQVENGVVDVAVKDEAEAVAVAKRYLAYFQGPVTNFRCPDQRALRSVIPENRKRMYDVRRVIDLLADEDSVLELRRGFGLGMVTSLVRVAGRPLGVIANNPAHLAGAIDVPAADKACRFMQLCDAFDLPILFLCDTPGIMVGPEVETTGLVRHAARMFVTGASLSVPFFTLVTRKGYGLGAMTMAGGSFKAPLFTAAWPTAEFGGMGLEGAVKLGMRKELEAIEDPEQRKDVFEKMVAAMYTHGKAVNAASHFEIDAVIDPVESRTWISSALRSSPMPPPREHKKRPFVDSW